MGGNDAHQKQPYGSKLEKRQITHHITNSYAERERGERAKLTTSPAFFTASGKASRPVPMLPFTT